MDYKKKAQELLSTVGITINGKKPYDIQVNDDRIYARVFRDGTLGLGEGYMDGWWDVKKLDEFFSKVLRSKLKVKSFSLLLLLLKARLFNRQSSSRAFEVGEKHYDVGNDLYELMLDKRMVYSCAYWKNANNLDEAQEAKLDLICRKLQLKPGMKVLDIGCGWGSFVKYAAEKYRIKATGITISKEQANLARKLCKGLPVEIKLQDYRDINGKFDVIVSIGMFEHVGQKNYQIFMQKVSDCLKDDGLFLLHTFGNTKTIYSCDPWFDKYIFPNGMIPSIEQIGKVIQNRFVMEDWHNFGADYDRTLMTWYENLNKNWDKLSNKYDERFRRMWNYYLTCLAGSFRSRHIQIWQIVFSKKGILRGYTPVR